MKLTEAQIKALRFYAIVSNIGVHPNGLVRRDVYNKLSDAGLLTAKGRWGITDAGRAALAKIDGVQP